MRQFNKLAANLAVAVAVTTLFGASAFAESRPRDETRGQRQAEQGRWRGRDGGGQQQASRETQITRQGGPAVDSRWSRQTDQQWRSHDGGDRYGDYGRGNRVYGDRGARGNVGYGDRGYENRGHDTRGRDGRDYDRGHGMVGQGRISRLEHERGGYRVWIGGGRDAYWVPEARFRLYPLRVGLSVRFGGLWDPLGYWNVDYVGPMSGPYAVSGDLSGIVESVDYGRGVLVLRDIASGAFVTVALTGNDPRLFDLRRGDFVDLSGVWSRGLFRAYNLDAVRGGDLDRYRDGDGDDY